jgi:hypothetical protein
MKENLVVQAFDYSAIDPEVKSKLICLAGEINRESAAHIQHALALGEAVAAAHDLLAGIGCEGKFKPWVETECGISKSTAYNYMWAWQKVRQSV